MDESETLAMIRLLREGRAGEAMAAAERTLAQDPGDLRALAYRGIARTECGAVEAGIGDLGAAAERAEAAGDAATAAFACHYLGNALCREGKLAAGHDRLRHAAALGRGGGDLLTALCQVARRLGDAGAAREWGAQALAAKDAEASCPEGAEVPRRRPRAFDPEARDRNVIAYSLFGDDPYYLECAVTTARTVPYSYPEFRARFYCAAGMPEQVLRAIAAAGAEVRIAAGVPDRPFGGLMWRFLAFDDPAVDIVLVRDLDSPVLPRERAAVDLWLGSDAPFHVIRDDVQHTAPLLAGLWGGFTGLLPELGPAARAHIRGDAGRYCDQIFLRQFVWPRIRRATLAIDSVYRLGETVDFPPDVPKRGGLHVGCSWFRRQIVAAR